MHIPKEIRIYAIEVEDNQTYSETCSPSVEGAIPGIVEEIARIEELGEKENISPVQNSILSTHLLGC